ncbi:MAG: hypothetical protein NTX65_05700 [Ignavibacteriales bacterium]|nr:hypothetical protein [Ignavibacteriales bacterium]
MRFQKISRLIFVIVISLLLSCSNSDKEKEKQNSYSILLGEFKKQDQVEDFRSSLNPSLWSKLRIERVYERNYKLFYGRFSTSMEAGKSAYNFFSDSLITEYKITHEGKPTLDTYANVLFVAKYLDRPSVFNFNLITKQTEVEWSNLDEKVIALNPSKDNNTIFLTTAGSYGKFGGIRFIHNAKLYKYMREEEQSKEITEFGNGVQLYSYWENPDTLKINFTSYDSVNSGIVNQKIFPVDLNGILGKVNERSFDLLQNGFPAPPKVNPVPISLNNRFRFREVYSQGESYIYLRDFSEKSEQIIFKTKEKIKDGLWSDDGNYLFLITYNTGGRSAISKNEIGQQILIINAVEKKTIRIFSGNKYGNLLVHGKLLFFDEHSVQNSQIKIYDYKKDKIIYTISMFSGCGLANLPM